MKLLTAEWVPLPDDPATRFKIRGLTGLEFIEMQSAMDPDAALPHLKKGRVPLTPRMMRSALAGLEDWDAVTGADGADIPFSPATAARLPLAQLQWVVGQVLDRTLLAEDTEKNSESQSMLPKTAGPSIAETALTAGLAKEEISTPESPAGTSPASAT